MEFKSDNKIECYSCQKGSPIGNIFDLSVCPKGWTIDKNPCTSNTSKKYNLPSGDKVSLIKAMYKYKDVMGILDMGFSEFANKKPSPNAFFDLYNKNFYDMKRHTHSNIVDKSEDYIGSLLNPRNKEIQELKTQIEILELQIDSSEREHPIFPNGTILMDSEYNKTYQSGFGGISNGGQVRGVKWYIHSGKRRRITDNYEIYAKIKNKFGMKTLEDKDVIIFISSNALDTILTGPPVSKVKDLFKSYFEVNTYTP